MYAAAEATAATSVAFCTTVSCAREKRGTTFLGFTPRCIERGQKDRLDRGEKASGSKRKGVPGVPALRVFCGKPKEKSVCPGPPTPPPPQIKCRIKAQQGKRWELKPPLVATVHQPFPGPSFPHPHPRPERAAVSRARKAPNLSLDRRLRNASPLPPPRIKQGQKCSSDAAM